MNRIIIDTTKSKKTLIRLETDNLTDKIEEESPPRSQNSLKLIDTILKRNDLSPFDLNEIVVNQGPGSFTGTRVGVAIANALGFSLGVNVNGQKKKSVLPKYS